MASGRHLGRAEHPHRSLSQLLNQNLWLLINAVLFTDAALTLAAGDNDRILSNDENLERWILRAPTCGMVAARTQAGGLLARGQQRGNGATATPAACKGNGQDKFRNTVRQTGSGLDGRHCCLALFCIPQAGMGAWVYHSWADHLAAHGIELLPLELPGRNSRLREAPATCLTSLAQQVAQVVLRAVTSPDGTALPFALFGHSMGGWIAYEVVQFLMRRGGPLPVHLFVSGCRAPHLFAASDDRDPTRLHRLTDPEEFWAAFEARYGTNPHLAHPKVRAMMWPILRADFRLVETYQHPRDNRPLPVPTTVLAGDKDTRYDMGQIHAWRRHLEGGCSFVWLQGAAHDYVERGHPLLLPTLVSALAPWPQAESSSSAEKGGAAVDVLGAL